MAEICVWENRLTLQTNRKSGMSKYVAFVVTSVREQRQTTDRLFLRAYTKSSIGMMRRGVRPVYVPALDSTFARSCCRATVSHPGARMLRPRQIGPREIHFLLAEHETPYNVRLFLPEGSGLVGLSIQYAGVEMVWAQPVDWPQVEKKAHRFNSRGMKLLPKRVHRRPALALPEEEAVESGEWRGDQLCPLGGPLELSHDELMEKPRSTLDKQCPELTEEFEGIPESLRLPPLKYGPPLRIVPCASPRHDDAPVPIELCASPSGDVSPDMDDWE